jgi:hypothetical protein
MFKIKLLRHKLLCIICKRNSRLYGKDVCGICNRCRDADAVMKQLIDKPKNIILQL